MAKKKFYITDIASVANALNLMSETYAKDIRNLNKASRYACFSILVTTGSIYMLKSICKNHNARINALEAEIKKLKEGNQMTEGE